MFDYNKPSEIWFTVFDVNRLTLNISNEIPFIVSLTEEATANMKSINDVHKLFGPEYVVVRGLGLPGAFLVNQIKIDTDNTLDNNKNVAHFEIDTLIPLDPQPEPEIITQTNDNDWNRMWGLNRSNTFSINVEPLWDAGFVGSRDVVVGICDTGVQDDHPDLADNMWINPNPSDMSDGYNNDLHGIGVDPNTTGSTYRYGGQFTGPILGMYNNSGSHGTHVAGTVGAVGNNNIGIVGVCQQVSLMSLNCFRIYTSECGTGRSPCPLAPYSAQTTMLNYAALKANSGVNIAAINMSLGGLRSSRYNENSTVYRSHLACCNAGIVMVYAAGNSNISNDSNFYYPSNFADVSDYPSLIGISVAAMRSDGSAASFSNWGAAKVQIAAPGDDIRSTMALDTYANKRGTSMAAPHVAGAVGLLRSMFPSATARQIRNAIVSSARPTSAFSNTSSKPVLSGGRLDVQAAANILGDPTPLPPPPGPPPVPGQNSVTVRNVNVTLTQANNHPLGGCGSNITPVVTWDVDYSGSCNDDNTVFDLIMQDLDAGSSVHWFIGPMYSSSSSPTRRVPDAAGGIYRASIKNTSYTDLQNAQGYVGPWPGVGSSHRYRIRIDPRTSVSPRTVTGGTVDVRNFVCTTASSPPPPPPPPPGSPPPPPPPPPPPVPAYPSSTQELYAADLSGNIFVIDISNKGNPSIVTDSSGKVLNGKLNGDFNAIKSMYTIPYPSSSSVNQRDYFIAGDNRSGSYTSGTFVWNASNNFTGIVSHGKYKTYYAEIVMNQVVENLEHIFRYNSNIFLSYDPQTSLFRGQPQESRTKWLRLDNVKLSPVRDANGQAKRFILSSTTCLPDYLYPLGWLVQCRSNSFLNRYFYRREEAVLYLDSIKATCPDVSIIDYGSNGYVGYTSLPQASIFMDHKDVILQIMPTRGSKQIYNAKRPWHKLKNSLRSTILDQYSYPLYQAGYNAPSTKGFTSILDSSGGGIGRTITTGNCITSTVSRPEISRFAASETRDKSSDPARTVPYTSAIKTIAGKFQTIAIDSNGDAYYTGNQNYGPFGSDEIVPLSTSGGEISYTSDGYTVHTFKNTGSFNISSLPLNSKFDILVVGGGGGAGTDSKAAGGGGAGGLIHKTNISFPSAGRYTITIGAGGSSGRNGQDSSIIGNGLSYIAKGGGGGGVNTSGDAGVTGGSGGSGAGGTRRAGAGGGTTGQGHAGGPGKGGRTYIAAGGGGGAGGPGIGGDGHLAWDPTQKSRAYHLKGGDGGLPYACDISGATKYYAGGGGGAPENAGPYMVKGLGGGGRDNHKTANNDSGTLTGPWKDGYYANNPDYRWPVSGDGGGGGTSGHGGGGNIGHNGLPNTGGGGGARSGAGGSGIVIIRYRTVTNSGTVDPTESAYFKKIPTYELSSATGTDIYTPTVENFVDAAIMTYNHRGEANHDHSSYTVFLLTDTGKIYRFGYNPNSIMSKRDFIAVKMDEPIIHGSSTYPIDSVSAISAGCDHVIIIRHGYVYGMGSNARGQLAHAQTVPHIAQFTLLPATGGDSMKIACGPYHTMLLRSGGLYTCGDNTVGQLGVNLNPKTSVNNHQSYTWRKVDHPRPIVDIFASNVSDPYVYSSNVDRSGNLTYTKAKSACGFLDHFKYTYIMGDNSSYQNGVAVEPTTSGWDIMIRPQNYVWQYYSAIGARGTKAKYELTNIPKVYTNYIKVGTRANVVWHNTKTTSAGTKTTNSSGQPITTFTASRVDVAQVNMYVHYGVRAKYGSGDDRGRIIAINTSTRTITVSGHYNIATGQEIAYNVFPVNTYITKIIDAGGTLTAELNNAAAIDFNDKNYTVRIWNYLRPDKVVAGKDCMMALQNGVVVFWGLDKGYTGCRTSDIYFKIPWILLPHYNDFYDISCGLEHVSLLRKTDATVA